MTIEGRNGFRLFLRLFALGNGLFALFLFALTRPRLATPLFEFPLLASLHALVLGALLPLLLGTLSRDTPLFRVACLFVCAGEMVLVTGFLSLPRSPLPMEGGLLVSAGLDLIVPFPGYTDADITDISRRTLYDTLSRFLGQHPFRGMLDVDPEIPAFLTYQVDPSTITVSELNRKIQAMILPVLKKLESQAVSTTPESSLWIGIVDNHLDLVEGVPAATGSQSASESS